MPQISFVNLLIVATVAVLAPLLIGYLPRLRLPAVVVEIVAGVVLGPSVLGWVHIDLPVQILAVLGLAFLLFLAGLEIDLRTLRGHVLRLAVRGYGLTLVLGVAVGVGFGAVDWTRSPLLVAIALSATSLGLVVPVLKDAGQVDGLVGQTIIASSTVADFAAIVLLTLFFSASGRGVGSTLVLLAIFAGLVVIVGVLLTQVGRSMRLGMVLVRLQDTTAEIRVRMSVALLIGFVATAERFGLETILGAFLAGAVVSLIDRDSASHPHFRIKLDAIGYGFLVPVFFVASGRPARFRPARSALGPAPRSCVLTCAAGGPRSASAALPIRPRPPRDHRGGATAGNLAAVPCDRGNHRHAGWHDLVGDWSRVDLRWPAVGRDLPGGCPLEVA
jgi:Kef-type K+ transport system membrane component KefB